MISIRDSRGNKSLTLPLVYIGCLGSFAALFTGYLSGTQFITFWGLLAAQWGHREHLEKKRND